MYNSFSTGEPWSDSNIGRYNTLKEEILESRLVSIQTYQQDILFKARQYQTTQRGKQAIYHYEAHAGILEMRGDGLDPLDPFYKIEQDKRAKARRDQHPFEYGDTMSINHLIAIICYTDFTELCTKWTSTFRSIYFGESQQSMKLRQEQFYHLSKYLYQIVQYFGEYCHGIKYGFGVYSWSDVDGPFFCGMNRKMPFNSFNIKLNGPTSTSRHREVALRFSGEQGILIQFNNSGLKKNHRVGLFDASWISRFKEEDEV